MKEEFTRVIEELSEIIKHNQLNVSDDELFDVSARIYLTQEINKNRENTFKLKNELSPKEYLQDTKGLATPNQLSYLRKNNIPFPSNISKREAYELIKKHKG